MINIEKLSWSKEDKLILSILNLKGVASEDLSPINTFEDREGIDFDRFLDLAREEGLSALLFKILKENGLIQRFPAIIQKSLRDSYLLSLTNNIVLMNDLSRVILSFEEKGIKTIVLKGMALLERVYQDIGVRPVMDIDLLICDGDQYVGPTLCSCPHKVREILEGLGYRLTSTCPMIYDNGRTIIDIHTDIDSFTRLGSIPYTPKLNTTTLWERGYPYGVSFNSVRILSPEDTVLTLSIHLVKHSFLRLLWLIDIIEVIKATPGFDWKKLDQRARDSDFGKILYYVLLYIKEVFGIIPGHLLSEVNPGRMGLIERRIMDRIIKNERKDGYGDILYFYSIKGIFRRLLFITRILFPEKKKAIEISGSRYLYLYYPKRVFELFIMGGRFLWNYISGNRQSARPASRLPAVHRAGSEAGAVGSLGGERL